jgi:hypothetical protein
MVAEPDPPAAVKVDGELVTVTAHLSEDGATTDELVVDEVQAVIATMAMASAPTQDPRYKRFRSMPSGLMHVPRHREGMQADDPPARGGKTFPFLVRLCVLVRLGAHDRPIELGDVPRDVAGRKVGELVQRQGAERQRHRVAAAALRRERSDRLRHLLAAGAELLERRISADHRRRFERRKSLELVGQRECVQRFLEPGGGWLGHGRRPGEHARGPLIGERDVPPDLRGAPRIDIGALLRDPRGYLAKFANQMILRGVEPGKDESGAVGIRHDCLRRSQGHRCTERF